MSLPLYKTKSLIIGGGPAGYTSAIYLARYGRSPIVVTGPLPGGQLMLTKDVENFPGFAQPIEGPWLMEQCQAQAQVCGATLHQDTILSIDWLCRPFLAKGVQGIYEADTLILAMGASTLWLNLESESHFRGYGVSSCATCDGRMFRGKEVAVVGGGNTALEEALFLAEHAQSVTIIHRREVLRADKVLQDRAKNHQKISFLWNHIVEEVKGEEHPYRHVTGIMVKNLQSQESYFLKKQGLFIAIGHAPNTTLVKDTLPLDAQGYILTEKGSAKTKIEGVFAAGDVQDHTYRQAITAAGQGCMAAMDAERFLQGAL